MDIDKFKYFMQINCVYFSEAILISYYLYMIEIPPHVHHILIWLALF